MSYTVLLESPKTVFSSVTPLERGAIVHGNTARTTLQALLVVTPCSGA